MYPEYKYDALNTLLKETTEAVIRKSSRKKVLLCISFESENVASQKYDINDE